MTTSRRTWLRGAGVVLAAGWAGMPTSAQEVAGASRPITLVVPFAAGGGTDTVARLLGVRLQALLGRTVVIENRPGANGIVASQAVLQQPDDVKARLSAAMATIMADPTIQQ